MTTDVEPRAARRDRVILFAIAAIVLAFDQVTKAIAVATLSDGPVPVIDCCLHWTLQRNPGSAFGFLARFPALFTVLAFAISITIVVMARKVPDRAHATGLGLVLGGAVGNLVDRIAREPAVFRGHVVDFIDLRVWPVFNIADSGIVVGAALLVWASWRYERVRRDA